MMTKQNKNGQIIIILGQNKTKMLGLSFNTKSNVPVFAVFKCQNIIYPYNIHIKQNALHNFTAVWW